VGAETGCTSRKGGGWQGSNVDTSQCRSVSLAFQSKLGTEESRAIEFWLQVNIIEASMEDNVSHPLVALPLPHNPHSTSYQQQSELRDDIHPVQDHSAEHLIPHQNPFKQASSQHRIASSSALASSEDEKGSDEYINTIGTRRQNEKRSRSELLRVWWLELLCCVLFIGALAAVVITIYPFKGRPLPQ
jgi:hypothetical protein